MCDVLFTYSQFGKKNYQFQIIVVFLKLFELKRDCCVCD